MSVNRPDRMIRATRPFFMGDRTVTPQHDPFPVDYNRAQDLIVQGLAVAVVMLDTPPVEAAVSPAHAKAQRATSRRQ